MSFFRRPQTHEGAMKFAVGDCHTRNREDGNSVSNKQGEPQDFELISSKYRKYHQNGVNLACIYPPELFRRKETVKRCESAESGISNWLENSNKKAAFLGSPVDLDYWSKCYLDLMGSTTESTKL